MLLVPRLMLSRSSRYVFNSHDSIEKSQCWVTLQNQRGVFRLRACGVSRLRRTLVTAHGIPTGYPAVLRSGAPPLLDVTPQALEAEKQCWGGVRPT